MNFSELESRMAAHGISTLAEISRVLDTTPQAVSNWKSRDQVPYHIISKVNRVLPDNRTEHSFDKINEAVSPNELSYHREEPTTISDIFLTLARQIKIIFLTTFISIFIAFTYVQFIKQPQYISKATLLLPENNSNMGNLMGLASQFGINIPTSNTADLSSPSLFPELITSRVFLEKIIDKRFFQRNLAKNYHSWPF